LRQVQLPASQVARRLNQSKVDIKDGDLRRQELLLLRARLRTRAVAEDARLSKPERRLRLAWRLRAEVEGNTRRGPMGNQAVLPEAELQLDLSLVRENQRAERKKGKNLLPRLLVLRQDRLQSKFEVNGGPGML
jgi:hypothetical protein